MIPSKFKFRTIIATKSSTDKNIMVIATKMWLHVCNVAIEMLHSHKLWR